MKLSKTSLLTQTLTKISLFLGLIVLAASCNAVKHLKEDELLLQENTIELDGKKTNDPDAYSLIRQKPNSKIPVIGTPFSLHIYNLAEENPDSTYKAWLDRKPNRRKRMNNFFSEKQVNRLGQSKVGFNNWLKRTGSAPVIIDPTRSQKSLDQLKRYYFTRGWFNVDGSYTILKDSTKQKRGKVEYSIQRKTPYTIGNIEEQISSPIVDSIFQATKNQSFIRPEEQYNASNFQNERDRITIQMRNSGLYYFQQEYVTFEADTNSTGHKVHVDYIIPDRRIGGGDTVRTEPFKIYTINEVRVVTDYSYANRSRVLTDSTQYNGYKLYSYDEMNYRPKAITDAIAILPNDIFQDIDRTLTYNQISELRNFKYPNISYEEDPADTTGTGLVTTILLSPRKKYNFSIDFDTYTSQIQQFGIGFNSRFLIRNVFKGAENFEISFRGSVGSSKDVADSNSSFFNTSDVGVNAKLSIPNILFPANTNKIIPKYMSPFTTISAGLSTQKNIGLDRQSFDGIFSYQWKPRTTRTNQFELFNLQYVRNLNPNNYWNVYTTSYDRLNEIARDSDYQFEDNSIPRELGIPEEADNFLVNGLTAENPYNMSEMDFDEAISIAQRQNRLTENNLIFSTSYTWIRDSRQNIYDNNFSRLRFKIVGAGNMLSLVSGAFGFDKNANGNYELFGVQYSQYAKFETNFIRHWEFPNRSILAIRAFGGIAVPYGNSNSIPFNRSYFAGGPNDNRGWRAYDLGPGSSGSILDFNEANFKLAFNAEYRFTILGSFKGAIFADLGNIWNIWDNQERPEFVFEGLQDLSELALATGPGLRYDFGFFVLRFDVGFKTYDPARPEGTRWFKDYNFGNAVYNIGINYPF